jgi:hypothetical protein
MFLSEQNVIIALKEEVRGGCALSSFLKFPRKTNWLIFNTLQILF